MPSSATITAFYSFTAKARLRVGQVNQNFSVLRGHFIPIDPNTATSVDNTHDLGSSENRWRTLYASKIDVSVTSTSQLTIEADTAGSFSFKNNGVEILNISETGISGLNGPINSMTTTGDIGDLAASSTLNITTLGATYVAGSTCTLTTNGRPIYVGLMPDNAASGDATVDIYNPTGASRTDGKISFVRDGTITCSFDLNFGSPPNVRIPAGAFFYLDTSQSGTYKFSLLIHDMSASALAHPSYTRILNLKLFAFEL